MATTMKQPARRSTDRNPKVMHQPAGKITDRNPKVTHHQPPQSLVSKKHPSRVSELESQITLLQEDLRRTREQLASSESQKRQVQQEVEESKNQLSILFAKYEDCERWKVDLAASEDARIQELRKLSQERDWAWQSELDAMQNQRSFDSAALSSALKEIQRLKMHLSKVIKSESAYTEQSEIAHSELQELKQEVDRTLSTVENLKIQLRYSEQCKAKAEAGARETKHLLEITKTTVETLLSDGSALMESFNSIVSELEKSRAQENLLEETTKKLQADQPTFGSLVGCDYLESEVEDLTLALENIEVKYQEEQIRNMVLIQSAYELEEKLRNESILREADLQSALTDTEAAITGLKAKLLEKEAQLRDVSGKNERLHSEIREQVSQIKSSLGSKLMQSAAHITELKAKIKDEETELQEILLENEMLKSEMKEREEIHKSSEAVLAEVELARAKEQEAAKKLGIGTEELDISSRMAARLTEQLDAVQAVKEYMELELKRLRVQSGQWRKAAETAMAVLTTEENGSSGNGSSVEKLMNSPLSDNLDDISAKTRNTTMLRRMGELWKKGQK